MLNLRLTRWIRSLAASVLPPALPPGVPLDLPGLIMRRAVVVALAGLLLGLWLGLMRLQTNVREELEAARVLATLSERLALLAQQDDAQALRAMRDWQAQGELRHLSLRLSDARGANLLPSPPAEAPDELPPPLAWLTHWLPPPPPFTVAWRLPRPGGEFWSVALSAQPHNEQREAWQFTLEGVGVLALVATLMLLVMRWNTRRALAPLAVLLGAIGQLREGQREPLHQLPPMPVAELQAVAQALRELAQALAQAEAQQRHLVQQMISLQDDERQRLARELHDEFGQHLTALRVDAAWLLRRWRDAAAASSAESLANPPASLHPEAYGVLQGMAGQIERIQQDIRATLARLRPLPAGLAQQSAPAQLAELGQLLAELVQGWQRAPGVGCAFALDLAVLGAQGQRQPWPSAQAAALAALPGLLPVDGQPADALPADGLPTGALPAGELPAGLAAALYRISQEALTNVARHAQARQALLCLHWLAPPAPGQAAQLLWQVQDDGLGLPELGAALRRGNGLAGIKERIWAQGAELEYGPARSATPPGLRLAARFSLAKQEVL